VIIWLDEFPAAKLTYDPPLSEYEYCVMVEPPESLPDNERVALEPLTVEELTSGD
jgi:hypothetical protein